MSMFTKSSHESCAICGESDQRALGEYHHTYGRANSPEILLLCYSCHKKITADQNLFPPRARSRKANEEDKRAFEDVSIGSLLELLGGRLKKRGMDKHGDSRPSV